MIKVGNIVIDDWILINPMPYSDWRAFIKRSDHKTFSERNYLAIRLIYPNYYYKNGKTYHDNKNSKWWLFFYDEHNLFEAHSNMYGTSPKYREFSSKEDAIKHANEFLIKLDKLRMFI